MSLPLLPVALLAASAPVAAPAQVRTEVSSAPFVLVADTTALTADDQTAPPAGDATIGIAQIEAAAGSPPQVGALPTDTAAPPLEGDTGDLVVQAREQVPGDPLEDLNSDTYQLVSKVDEAVIEPVAMAYRDGLPRQIRDALSNFFSNLREPVVALNYLLQFKPGKAAETVARFAINSTLGVAGLIDVAEEQPFNLPYRRNGFANTLGYHGVGQGPFLVIPLVGATTLRDLLGSGIDQLVMPTAVGRPFTYPAYGPIAFTVNSLDYRIENDDNIARYSESADPYSAMRDAYLARRQAEIDALHGRGPLARAVPTPSSDSAALPTSSGPTTASPPVEPR